MPSSGTKTFTLDLGEIITDAFEALGPGYETYTGEDFRTARRSLNLLLTEWQNDDVNLWTLSLATLTLTSGTNSYTLPTTVIDVIDAACRTTDSVDLPMQQIGFQDYLLSRPVKSTTGRPTEYAIQRTSAGGHTLYSFPAPSNSNDKIVYWAMSYMDDVSATGANQTLDVPKRFLPALIAGLAYKLAVKKLPEQSPKRIELKQEYEAVYQKAKDADRERSSFMVTPWTGRN